MPTAMINGITIYYEIHGEGFPLILAYGLGGSTKDWAGQIEILSRRYKLILWDPRGHGRSESPSTPEEYSLDISARDLLELLNHLEIQKAYLGGLSMGAGIALRHTIVNPERVAALLLIDSQSASEVPVSGDMRAMRERTITLAETVGMTAVADFLISNNPNLQSQADAGPAQREQLRIGYLSCNPTGYAGSVRALLDPPIAPERIATVRCPTMVLVGDQDPSKEPAWFTHKLITGSEYVMIKDAGHLSNKDKPVEFNRAVLKFLDQVDAKNGPCD